MSVVRWCGRLRRGFGPPGDPGRVSWARAAALGVPAAGAVVLLLGMIGSGALGASFTVSGRSFKFSAADLDGRGIEQYPATTRTGDGARHPVAVTRIGDATIRDLCQSMRVRLPGGSATLRITAGHGTPVRASALVVDAEHLAGDVAFTGFETGRDAATLDRVPGGAAPAGMFGQQASRVRIEDLRLVAWSATSGTFRLSGLRLGLRWGDHECF
ncbi:MAG TPA: DUF6230 family protein [Thermomonospora sp.]|nr:DUF6230 family protein [Thermomonospora sp.]